MKHETPTARICRPAGIGGSRRVDRCRDAGARRSDLLRLEWETDTDFDGAKVVVEGRTGPHIYIRGSKADTPHWLLLHPAAVTPLEMLRREPVIDRKVFLLKQTGNPKSYVSHAFADLCIDAGVARKVIRKGRVALKNGWKLPDLRRKSNTDLRSGGAGRKGRWSAATPALGSEGCGRSRSSTCPTSTRRVVADCLRRWSIELALKAHVRQSVWTEAVKDVVKVCQERAVIRRLEILPAA